MFIIAAIWNFILSVTDHVIWFVHDLTWSVIDWLGAHPLAILAGLSTAAFWAIIRHDARKAL